MEVSFDRLRESVNARYFIIWLVVANLSAAHILNSPENLWRLFNITNEKQNYSRPSGHTIQI